MPLLDILRCVLLFLYFNEKCYIFRIKRNSLRRVQAMKACVIGLRMKISAGLLLKMN